ncbi:MAG: hypothetical protein ISR45_10390 [Rhodospirillales bacterium]|nr:hypothetical protein [Rhodospirillales bacterium]
MNPKTIEELLEEAQKVSSVIATARRLIADDKTVDLANLEGKVQALCEDAEASDMEGSTDVEEAFNAIVQDLNQLNEEMSAKIWTDSQEELENTAKRAIDAYKSDSGDQ